MENKFPIVLLTGASSGIGLALARKLVQLNYRVVATARESSLERNEFKALGETPSFIRRKLDINSKLEREELIREISDIWGNVDILINNAGISYSSVIEHISENDEVLQMQTNFISPMELIRLVLPGMRAKREGRIINVSSVGGMMAMPTMGSYSASKFALEGASEALWYELRPWNINVTLVQPGFINSDSFRHVYLNERAKYSLTHIDPYHTCYWYMSQFIEKLMTKTSSTSESVAEVICKTMSDKNPALRVAGTKDAYFFGLLRRIFPRRLYHEILYRMLPGVNTWGK